GARVLYERFAPFANRSVVIGFGVGCWGSVERYLGLLCVTLGQHAAAAEHFERAITANRRIGGALPLAYTMFDYALLLQSSGGAERAVCLLHEARAIAEERDLVALLARLSALGA
ncbi:MAG TPA: tetratricopeptide repeat protein, partial [Polyangiaceae bacterium]